MNTVNKEVILSIIAGFLIMSAIQAYADDMHVLAKSKTHKLQIVSEGGDRWCTKMLILRMVLEPDSPDVMSNTAKLEIMNRLKSPLTNECPSAEKAELTVIEQGKPSGKYEALAREDWKFAAAPTSPKEEPLLKVAPKPPAPVDLPLINEKQLETTISKGAESQTGNQVTAPDISNTALPRDTDYVGALVHILRGDHELAKDEGTLRWWARYRNEKEYAPLASQEFKLRPLLEKAQADLIETMAQAGKKMTILLPVEIGVYDFNAQRFPVELNINMQHCTLSNPRYYDIKHKLPYSVKLEIVGLELIKGLPMEAATAQSFIDKRTNGRSVNRKIILAVTVLLDDSGFRYGDGRQLISAAGSVERAEFFDNRQTNQLLGRLTKEDLEKQRAEIVAEKVALVKAEEERQLNIKFQRLQEQRDKNIQILSKAPVEVRLANFIIEGDVNTKLQLANLRGARAASLIKDKPVNVAMLVQASSTGRNKIETKWPGNLQVSMLDGQPEMQEAGWYLVLGQLNVPAENAFLCAQLTVQNLYSCTQEQCREATDAAAIIDRKLVKSNTVLKKIQ